MQAMQAIAYLFNRYPEATLTTLRREVRAVSGTGMIVSRFAHRPSSQPLASEVDRFEAEQTKYLATSGVMRLFLSLIKASLRNPIGFLAALRVLFSFRPFAVPHFGHLAIACRLMDYLRTSPVDIVHTHFAQNSASVAMLTEALGGPPWTMTVHGPEDFDTGRERGLAMRVRSARTTIAISKHAADAVLRALGCVSVDIRILSMGVDDLFLRAPVPIPTGSPIVFIARFVQRKGHSVFLKAMDILRSRGIRPTVKLIGDGPLRTDVAAEVERTDLSSQIEFCDWQSEEAIKSSIDASSFLILPSLAEGLPVTIMEAFARARPVIASNVGAVGELIHDGANGALVAPGDAYGLADAIQGFLKKDADELFAMGLLGRADVRERHDARKNGEALVSIWHESCL